MFRPARRSVQLGRIPGSKAQTPPGSGCSQLSPTCVANCEHPRPLSFVAAFRAAPALCPRSQTTPPPRRSVTFPGPTHEGNEMELADGAVIFGIFLVVYTLV